MTLKPQTANQIPEETARVAKAAFPKPNVYMRMRDEFGHLYTDEIFAELFSEPRMLTVRPQEYHEALQAAR